MDLKIVETALLWAGFARVDRSSSPLAHLGTSFQKGTSKAGWVISAWVANPPETLDVTLQRAGMPKGTQFKVLSDRGLGSALTQILADIERLLANEDLLRCPACGVRYVHVKHGPHGDFLSCDGMRIMGSRARGKSIPCRGVSTRIPPTRSFP